MLLVNCNWTLPISKSPNAIVIRYRQIILGGHGIPLDSMMGVTIIYE